MIKLQFFIQALFWMASVAFAAGTYFHTQQTVNKRVDYVESMSSFNSRVLCQMAIDQKSKSAIDICTKDYPHKER
ncbi:MAG: hypothetical protein KDH96_10265 [Candidatus Riesia sp.]|nr:hypothetical protein [Candidatus Riesia sp.]